MVQDELEAERDDASSSDPEPSSDSEEEYTDTEEAAPEPRTRTSGRNTQEMRRCSYRSAPKHSKGVADDLRLQYKGTHRA